MSRHVTGPWTNGALGNQTYWGLTRVVGPTPTTREDVERAKSQPGMYYSNSGAWFQNNNPGGFDPTIPPTPKENFKDNIILATDDFDIPTDMAIPRISPRGARYGKKVVGERGTGSNFGTLGVSNNGEVEIGGVGVSEEAQPARKQTSAKKFLFPPRKMNKLDLKINTGSFARKPSDAMMGIDRDTLFARNERRGSDITPIKSTLSRSSSMMSLDTPMQSSGSSASIGDIPMVRLLRGGRRTDIIDSGVGF